jgi:dihydroneopterin aldolase
MMDPPRLARAGQRHVFLRDMVLPASIGVYPHEHDAPQRIRINIDLGVTEGGVTEGSLGPQGVGLSRAGVGRDDLSRVVDYEAVARSVRDVVASGHVMLVETLAERLAETCLLDERVQVARVRVEKLDVFADLAAVGVEIERHRVTCPPGAIDSQ